MLPRCLTALLCLALLAPTTACLRAARTDASVVKPSAERDDGFPTVDELDFDRWQGQWFVLVTTFEFWTRRNRSDASFVYTPLPHSEARKMWDVTYYMRDDAGGRYMGVDTADPTDPAHFMWQGVGGTAGIRNHWYVLRVADDYSWALIGFAKSAIGISDAFELIARDPDLDPAIVEQAFAWAAEQPRLCALMQRDGLHALRHHQTEPRPAQIPDACAP